MTKKKRLFYSVLLTFVRGAAKRAEFIKNITCLVVLERIVPIRAVIFRCIQT